MEEKIDEILERIFIDSIEFDRNKACEELLNLFGVIKCENFKCNNKAEYFYCNDCENERNDI